MDTDNTQVTEKTNTKEKCDGSYILNYTEEGVFLNIIPAKNGGKAIDTREIIMYIKRKNLENADMRKITTMITSGSEENDKIALAQEEKILDEGIEVDFSQGKMEAYLELLKGEEKGKILSKEEILKEIKETYNVTYGLVLENIDDIINNRKYNHKTLIAKGKFAVDGENGKLSFQFEADTSNRPKFQTKEDGKLDFRTLNNIQNVTKDQVLIIRIPATDGENGFDVCGKEITAKRGKEAMMPGGKNVYLSDDHLTMFSATDGRVEYVSGKVVVSQAYEINGNLDLSVGNVDFPGDVIVKGKVTSGFSIIAGGNITVGGLCEGATLRSEGSIFLKGGIQGGGKGLIIAKKDVIAKFIERATVEAEQKVVSDFILHSKVMCEGCIEVITNKGIVLGGSISACDYIAAKFVGADSGIATEITLGVSPKKRETYQATMQRMELVNNAIQRIELSLHSTLSSVASIKNAQARIDITTKLMTLKTEYAELKKTFEEIDYQINNASDGQIHILGEIYPGVKVAIGSHFLAVRENEKYVTYKVEEGDISRLPCKFKA